MKTICSICKKRIKQNESTANPSVGEDTEGRIIVEEYHFNCAINLPLNTYQKQILEE